MYFLSNMNIKNEIFIIGKNNFGINSLNNIFKEWIILKKIKYKKKCTLYYGRIQKKPIFILKKLYFYIQNPLTGLKNRPKPKTAQKKLTKTEN